MSETNVYGTEVTLDDGTVIDVGKPIDTYVVAGDGGTWASWTTSKKIPHCRRPRCSPKLALAARASELQVIDPVDPHPGGRRAAGEEAAGRGTPDAQVGGAVAVPVPHDRQVTR